MNKVEILQGSNSEFEHEWIGEVRVQCNQVVVVLLDLRDILGQIRLQLLVGVLVAVAVQQSVLNGLLNADVGADIGC